MSLPTSKLNAFDAFFLLHAKCFYCTVHNGLLINSIESNQSWPNVSCTTIRSFLHHTRNNQTTRPHSQTKHTMPRNATHTVELVSPLPTRSKKASARSSLLLVRTMSTWMHLSRKRYWDVPTRLLRPSRSSSFRSLPLGVSLFDH